MGILTPLRSTMKTWVYFLEPPCLGGQWLILRRGDGMHDGLT